MLAMLAEKATPSLGFDTATRITADLARTFRAQGWVWCARYLHRSTAVDGLNSTLSQRELDDILGAGLALMPIQLGNSKLVASEAEGTQKGSSASANARTLGIPAGVTLWCDLEWNGAAPSSDADVLAYLNAWAKPIVEAGYRPGLYVGPNVPLTGEQLFHDLPQFRHYWKAASKVPWVEKRGFQVMQSLRLKTNDVDVDADVIVYDAKGDRPFWVVAG